MFWIQFGTSFCKKLYVVHRNCFIYFCSHLFSFISMVVAGAENTAGFSRGFLVLGFHLDQHALQVWVGIYVVRILAVSPKLMEVHFCLFFSYRRRFGDGIQVLQIHFWRRRYLRFHLHRFALHAWVEISFFRILAVSPRLVEVHFLLFFSYRRRFLDGIQVLQVQFWLIIFPDITCSIFSDGSCQEWYWILGWFRTLIALLKFLRFVGSTPMLSMVVLARLYDLWATNLF